MLDLDEPEYIARSCWTWEKNAEINEQQFGVGLNFGMWHQVSDNIWDYKSMGLVEGSAAESWVKK